MLTADQHGLPRALAERLGDEARAAFAEAPREARFKLLAQALNLDEAALLAELARLTGLEVLEERRARVPRRLRAALDDEARAPRAHGRDVHDG